MLTGGPRTVLTPPNQSAGDPVGQSSGLWTNVLNEEFLGSQLNTQLWADHYLESDSLRCNDAATEVEWFPHDRRGVTIGGGYLTLTARHEVALDAPNPLPSGQAPAYTSGMIQSGPGFAMTYGYVEARVRMSNLGGTQASDGGGNWPAFWLYGADAAWGPEIDVLEWFSNTNHMNYYDPNGSAAFLHQVVNPSTPQSWHVVGCSWDSGHVRWYVDGVLETTYTGTISNLPMHPVCNYTIRNDATAADYPEVIIYDYVRAWTPVGVPARPAITAVTAGSGQVTVTFGAVSGATSYRATAQPVDAFRDGVPTDRPHAASPTTGASSPLTVTGLTSGAQYRLMVSAINATGYSIESALSAIVTPT